MDDEVSQSDSLMPSLMALGTLGIFCFLLWLMFLDSQTASCVTKARARGTGAIQIQEVRWSPSGGCEYFAGAKDAKKAWMAERTLMTAQSGR
jgi:hypothetical protein